MNAAFMYDFPKDSEVTRMLDHYYDGMILSRHHVFSTYNKYESQDPQKCAGNILTKRLNDGDVDLLQVFGLDAELEFYNAFKKNLQLVPTLDCGDHTDFVGMLNGQLTRFDVTTNVSSKQKYWKDYLRYENQVVVEWVVDNNDWMYYKADKDLSKLTCFGKEVQVKTGWEFQAIP
jgi:hypothetical protein